MKRSWLFGGTILLSSVAPAAADPVSGLVIAVGAAWAGQAAAAALVGAGLIAAGGIAAAAISIGVGMAISLVASKFLAPTQPEVARQKVMFNPRQPVSYMERVYGITRKGGPVAVTKFDNIPRPPTGISREDQYGWPIYPEDNDYRIYLVILASHEIDGVEAFYLDDRRITLSTYQPGPNVVGGNSGGFAIGEWYEGEDISLKPYLGAPDQQADLLMRNTFPEWTDRHDMAGLAHVRVMARRTGDEDFNTIYPNGMPILTPAIRGNNRIFDPRDGTRKFTRNWALCFAHELVEYQGLAVDWDEVAYEADQCDVLVATGDGTRRPRWRADGTFSDDMAHASIRAEFLTAADAFFYERDDGLVGFKAGRWIEPTLTLTAADFISIQISSVRDMDVANEYVAQYVEPLRDWAESPSGTWVVSTDGSRTRKEVKAAMASAHHQAVALAKRTARADHAEYKITGTLKFVGFDLRGERFARLELPEMGISCAIEIQSLTANEDWLTWSIEAISTEPDDWLVTADEEPARPVYDKLESSGIITPVTSLTVEAGASTSGSASLIARWGEQSGSYRQQLRYALSGTEDWQVVDIPRGVTRYEATGLLDGQVYEFQIVNQRSGKQSAWSQPITARAVADNVAPPALPRFEVTGGSGQAVIDFETPNVPAPRYTATRIYRGTTTSFGSATLVATAYGSPNVSDFWTDSGITADTYFYWGIPINGSGTPGPSSGPVMVNVL